jgi:hypothetical protein
VGLGGRCRSDGDCDGDFSNEDASGKRWAAVAEDNAALKARLGQCLHNYQKQSSCERSNLCHTGNARSELPRTHLAGVPTWIRFGALIANMGE